MNEPSGGEPSKASKLSTDLIEPYLRARGRRYFRGQHDGEYFFVANAHPWRLHVHLGISRSRSDVFTLRVNPACYFPATDGDRLASLADSWNQQDREVTAVLHGSSDPQRIGVVARSCRRIPDRMAFEDFASSADSAINAAIDFFGALPPTAVLAPPSRGTQPLVRDAG
jgi:hypothetical protein